MKPLKPTEIEMIRTRLRELLTVVTLENNGRPVNVTSFRLRGYGVEQAIPAGKTLEFPRPIK